MTGAGPRKWDIMGLLVFCQTYGGNWTEAWGDELVSPVCYP